jgi:hypothetical protein
LCIDCNPTSFLYKLHKLNGHLGYTGTGNGYTHVKCRMSLHFTEYIIDVWNNVNKTHSLNFKMKYSCDTFFWYMLNARGFLSLKVMHTWVCVAQNGQANVTDRKK